MDVHAPDLDFAALARTLIRDGVLVFPIKELATADLRREARQHLSTDISNFPEFKPDYVRYGLDSVTKHTPLVGGGFSALGNPGSFHCDWARKWRACVHGYLLRIARELVNNVDFPVEELAAKAALGGLIAKPTSREEIIAQLRFEQLFDRIMVRPEGKAPMKESWHRDWSPTASPGSLQFGGWTNFNEWKQLFSCVKGTHVHRPAGAAAAAGAAGAAHDPVADIAASVAGAGGSLGFSKLTAAQAALCQAQAGFVEIPAGHAMIFFDDLIHQVLPTPGKHTQIRLFLGAELTFAPYCLHSSLPRWLKDHAPITVKSNQEARVFPKLYPSCQQKLLEALTDAFKPEFLDPVTGKLPPVCKALSHPDVGLGNYYAPYSLQEVALYTPQPLFPPPSN